MAKELASISTKLFLVKEGAEEELRGLKSVPEMGLKGGTADKIEVSDLSDKSKRYISGLSDPGSDGISFGFWYQSEANSPFYKLKEIQDSDNNSATFKLQLPDGLSFTFSGEVEVVLSGIEVGSALEYTLNVVVNSEIDVTAPTFA